MLRTGITWTSGSAQMRSSLVYFVIVVLFYQFQVAHYFSPFQLFQRFTTFLSVTLSLGVGTTILSESTHFDRLAGGREAQHYENTCLQPLIESFRTSLQCSVESKTHYGSSDWAGMLSLINRSVSRPGSLTFKRKREACAAARAQLCCPLGTTGSHRQPCAVSDKNVLFCSLIL